jgi:hypothetical protein
MSARANETNGGAATIEAAPTVARPSAGTRATLNSASHSAASGVSCASSHANTRPSLRWRRCYVGSSVAHALPTDFTRIELSAVAQAYDRALACRQLVECDEQRAPLPRAVEILCRIDYVIGRLGQLTTGGDLGTTATKPPAYRVDGDCHDPGRETCVGTSSVCAALSRGREAHSLA